MSDVLNKLLLRYSKRQLIEIMVDAVTSMHECNRQGVVEAIAVFGLGMSKGDDGHYHCATKKPEGEGIH